MRAPAHRSTRARALLGMLLLGCHPLVAWSSTPMQFSRLSGDSGLSAGGVMSIVQDHQGFLWLGTEDGLDRYDGYELRHHVRERGRSGSLPNNWVSALAEDAEGTLWVGTDGGGVVGLNSRTANFDALPAFGTQSSVGPQEKIRVLRLGRQGRMWIGTRDNGLVLVDREHRRIQRFRHSIDDAATLSSDSVFAVFEDRTGAIWVGTAVGLDRLDPATGRVQRQTFPAPAKVGAAAAQARTEAPVAAILEDTGGDLWVASYTGLWRRSAGSRDFNFYGNRPADAHSLPDDRVQALLEDDAQRLWIGTAAGLALYDRARDRFDVYRRNPADVTTLPDDNISALYQDRGGLLWVGTKAGGAASWNSRSWSFGHHAGEGGVAGNVSAFAEDHSGRLWIANLGEGLDAVDLLHGGTAHYRHQANDAAGLPDDRVMALLVDHRGTLWAGTMTAGLARFDRQTQSFVTYRHVASDPTTLGAPGVMSLLEDSRGRIWAGTYGGGLSLLDTATNRFTRYQAVATDPSTLSSDRATALAEDRSGRIWIGTDGGGLCLLDPATGRVARFLHEQQDPHSISSNTIYAIRVDDRGTVWVGTRGGGLDEVIGSALDPTVIKFRNFAEAEGLPNTTIYGIEPDAVGRLWLSTNRGLSRLDPAGREVKNFRRAHGLQGDEFNFGAHYRSPSGELYFGGPNGYNAFYPERLQFDASPPPVVLTAFLKLNEPARTTLPHEQLREVRLGYREDIVTFEFAALDFASPADNRYRYRLEGFDKDWVDAGSKHRVTYTNLAGGNYLFRVRGANSDGKWNDDGLSLALTVEPPPWATTWAYMGYLIGLSLLIYAVWNNQHKKLLREEMYARRLVQDVRDRTAELGLRNEELERVNRQLKEASVTDPLTGLGNRRFLTDAVAAMMESSGTASDGNAVSTFALLIVDLDHLKPVNDMHGHEAGDQILLQFADILRRACRNSDFIARWGGDEFVIVYRDQDIGAAAVLAERIRAGVAKQIFRLADGKAARTSCSIGFSRYPFVHEAPDLLPWEQCLAVADAALYHAKKLRNGWVGWAGTAAAIKIPSIVSVLEREPEALEREGCLDVRRPLFRPDDTVNNLQSRRRSDV